MSSGHHFGGKAQKRKKAPEGAFFSLERVMGFEPTTPTLARLCSTPELHPHSVEGLMTESEKARKRDFSILMQYLLPRLLRHGVDLHHRHTHPIFQGTCLPSERFPPQ